MILPLNSFFPPPLIDSSISIQQMVQKKALSQIMVYFNYSSHHILETSWLGHVQSDLLLF
jgi:hypothetical protein